MSLVLLAGKRFWAWIMKRALAAPARSTEFRGLAAYPRAVAHLESMIEVRAMRGVAGYNVWEDLAYIVICEVPYASTFQPCVFNDVPLRAF